MKSKALMPLMVVLAVFAGLAGGCIYFWWLALDALVMRPSLRTCSMLLVLSACLVLVGVASNFLSHMVAGALGRSDGST